MKIVKYIMTTVLILPLSLSASKPVSASPAAVAAVIVTDKKKQAEAKESAESNLIINAGHNAVHKNCKTFYTARKINEGHPVIMGVFENCKTSGEIAFIKAFSLRGRNKAHFSVNGNFFAVICTDAYIDSYVTVFQIRKGGDITEIEGSPFKAGGGPSAISWKNNIAAICNWHDETISVFITDPSNGTFISLNQSPIKTMKRPELIEVSGNNIIVANAETKGKLLFDTFTVDLASKTLMRTELFNLAIPKVSSTNAEWQDE